MFRMLIYSNSQMALSSVSVLRPHVTLHIRIASKESHFVKQFNNRGCADTTLGWFEWWLSGRCPCADMLSMLVDAAAAAAI